MPALSPAFRKLLESGNTDNTVKVFTDQGACCADSETAISTYTNSAHNLGTTTLDSIEIDGTTYTFAAAASTTALLEAGIRAALIAAGYEEVGGKAVTVSGAASAAVASIKTTATVTKFVDSGSSDVALTAA